MERDDDRGRTRVDRRPDGIGWTYGATACAGVVNDMLADVVIGRDAFAAPDCWSAMVAAAGNATRAGAVGYPISAVDVALWDLKAKLLDPPLTRLFGAVHEAVPVYGSGGFTTYDDHQLAGQFGGWTHGQHIPRVKINMGEPGHRRAP